MKKCKLNNKGYIEDILLVLFVVILLILFIGAIIISIKINYGNKKTTICTVEDKWVKPYSKSSKYLVKCDNEVYEITDLFFKGKFNSSDIYAQLKKGKKYKINTTGYRIKILSNYKNINSFKEIIDN